MAAKCCRNLALLLGLLPAALAAHAATAAHWSQPRHHVEHGQASFYAASLHGRRTASGRRFDQRKLTAAHPDLPFGTEVRVTNLENGRSVQVEIIDRGPFTGHRAIDLSRAAAQRIGLTRETGLAPVLIEAIAPWIKGPTASTAGWSMQQAHAQQHGIEIESKPLDHCLVSFPERPAPVASRSC